MRIHTLDKTPANAHFPVTHTCFFSIDWPRYTSFEAASKKLLYAITNVRGIDADNTAEARSNANQFS